MMMKDSWLVQRLLRPRVTTAEGLKTRAHHVFGGGMLGITPEQWAVIDPVFEIDYMGAAEYEFGVFPRTMAALWERRDSLIGFHFELKKKHIQPEWRRKRQLENAHDQAKRQAKAQGLPAPRKPRIVARQDVEIYVLCGIELRDAIPARVAEMASGKMRHKESPRLDVLDSDEPNERLEGWLDLDNRFFFFTSRKMWEDACALFDLRMFGDEFRAVPEALQQSNVQG